MRFVKIKKKWLSDFASFYRENDLIKEDNQVNPDKVWMNPLDEKELVSSITKKFKKQNPLLPKKNLNASVGLYMLNIGPKTDKGVSKGYILIEEENKKEE